MRILIIIAISYIINYPSIKLCIAHDNNYIGVKYYLYSPIPLYVL